MDIVTRRPRGAVVIEIGHNPQTGSGRLEISVGGLVIDEVSNPKRAVQVTVLKLYEVVAIPVVVVVSTSGLGAKASCLRDNLVFNGSSILIVDKLYPRLAMSIGVQLRSYEVSSLCLCVTCGFRSLASRRSKIRSLLRSPGAAILKR